MWWEKGWWKTTPGAITLAISASLLLGLVLVVPLVFVAGGDSEEAGDTAASRACRQEFVPARLKAPTTAKFSDVSIGREGDSRYYTVIGNVDSQNSFGAMIRAKFSCYVAVEDGSVRAITVTVDG